MTALHKETLSKQMQWLYKDQKMLIYGDNVCLSWRRKKATNTSVHKPTTIGMSNVESSKVIIGSILSLSKEKEDKEERRWVILGLHLPFFFNYTHMRLNFCINRFHWRQKSVSVAPLFVAVLIYNQIQSNSLSNYPKSKHNEHSQYLVTLCLLVQ